VAMSSSTLRRSPSFSAVPSVLMRSDPWMRLAKFHQAADVIGEFGRCCSGLGLVNFAGVDLVHLDDGLRPRPQQVFIGIREPSMWAMTLTGRGSAKSARTSNVPFCSRLSAQSSSKDRVIRSMSGVSALIVRGLNALLTSDLSRVCLGGSESRIESECR